MAEPEMTKEEKIKFSEDGVCIDWFLQNLVDSVNKSPFEFGITLNVNGQSISGTLISGKRYFDLFATAFSSAWPGDDKEKMREVFSSKGDIYNNVESEDGPLLSQYLHLNNAKVVTPGGSMPNAKGVLWRGKINAVSGFSLGILQASKQ